MNEMSLKKIMERVGKEKAKRGTNVLGESRPLGSLQRSLLSTRAFRAHNRQQLMDESVVIEEGDPLTKQQSIERSRQRTKNKGKSKDPTRKMAAKKAHKGVSAAEYKQRATKGMKTKKRLGTNKRESSETDVTTYHEMLAAMDETERNEYFASISEMGEDAYIEYLSQKALVDAKCSEQDEEEDEEEDLPEKKAKKESRSKKNEQCDYCDDPECEGECEDAIEEKKAKKESARRKMKEQDEEQDEEEEDLPEKKAKKESRRKMKEQDEEEMDDEEEEDLPEKKSKKESTRPFVGRRPLSEEDADGEGPVGPRGTPSEWSGPSAPVKPMKPPPPKHFKAVQKMFAIAAKMTGMEKEQYHDFISQLHGVKIVPKGPGAEKAKKDYEALLKESVDPIGEMLLGSDESEWVEQGDLNPLGTDSKAKDVEGGKKVVGKDPDTDSMVSNPKGDRPEYHDGEIEDSGVQGQDRGQISGYGY